MSIVNPAIATAGPEPLVLGYAPASLRREQRQTRWAWAAFTLAGLTAVYSVVCGIGVAQAHGWDALGWLVIGFFGNWIGAGLGLVCGLIGCLQRRRRRARAAHSLWMNAVVAAAPVSIVGLPSVLGEASMATVQINVFAAWVGAFLGLLAGVVLGFWYHREEWLGGYASWPRRMLRLGHVSFFGIAAINLAYALTIAALDWHPPHPLFSMLLAASNFLMPLVCGLAAWRPELRRLFVVPVGCAVAGVGGLLASQILFPLM
jgi:hypothetical protein